MEYKVIIPEENYLIIEFIQEDLPGIASVNISLKDFEPKLVFTWHLSIMIQLEKLINNGMPAPEEVELIDRFEKKLDKIFKGFDSKKPNAIFLARVTWNNRIELIWRVFDAELANNEIQNIINKKKHPRPFDYRIDPDDEWKLTDWYLNNNK